jgi:ATP-dependent Clp protease ATP-binding subunit ClpC
MFERFTEGARRALFFARYEANQRGNLSVETEHLLLGLIRESQGTTSLVFARAQLPGRTDPTRNRDQVMLREKVATSVAIPNGLTTTFWQRVRRGPDQERPAAALNEGVNADLTW